MGESVTHIGEGAFAECTSLRSVTMGESVTHIGEGAISRCTSVTSNVTSVIETYFERRTREQVLENNHHSCDTRQESTS